MRYCIQCHRLLMMDELRHHLGGKCFDCFWPAPPSDVGPLTHESEAEYWRSDEAMKHD
jgi:hypothetical protein